MKNLTIILIALVLLVGIIFVVTKGSFFRAEAPEVTEEETTTPEPETVTPEPEPEPEVVKDEKETVIGTSVDGNDIMAYHFGTGDDEILFIGGIHSAFAPNTVSVAEELMGALESGDITVPEGFTVTVIPNMNPDASGSPDTLASRLNAHGVDLNRNFDCEWSEEGTWRTQTVDGGSAPFSEPESEAVKTYTEEHNVVGAVVYYAKAGGVFSSNCKNGVSVATKGLTNTYADASGYGAYEEFNFYEITGDMVNWFAKESIPAISVLLSDYTNTEWSKNEAGVKAVLNYFAE